MKKQRVSLWLSLALIIALVLAGCAPRAGAGDTAAMAQPDDIAVDLPALVIDFNSDGEASIGNVPVAQLAGMFGGGAAGQLTMPASTVEQMTTSNIQHLQVSNVPSGLLILVNGQPIPSLKWDGEQLVATAEVIEQLGAGADVLAKLLPLVAHFGIGAIVRFPVAEGVAQIPLYVEGADSAAVAAQQAQSEFLAAVGTPPKIVLPVLYEPDGTWRVGDLTDTEWSNLTGLPWSAARMTPQAMQSLKEAGITDIALGTDARGIHISINGKELPYIGWADGELNHVLDLADQMGLWKTLSDQGMNMGEIIAVVETLLPAVQAAETDIHVYFPAEVALSQ